jgi:hypothetical protein
MERRASRLTFCCRREPVERLEPDDARGPISTLCSLVMVELRFRRPSSERKLMPESVAWDRLCCDCLTDFELCMSWAVTRALRSDVESCCEMQCIGGINGQLSSAAAWHGSRRGSSAQPESADRQSACGPVEGRTATLRPNSNYRIGLVSLRPAPPSSVLLLLCRASIHTTIPPAADHHRPPGSGAWTFFPKAPCETAATDGLGITGGRPGR